MLKYDFGQTADLARVIKRNWEVQSEEIYAVVNSFCSMKTQDQWRVKQTLSTAASMLQLKEADQLSIGKLDILDAMTGLKFRLRIAQSKLLTSKCLGIILEYLKPSKLIALQLLSRKFYDTIVPQTVPFICQENPSVILVSAQIRKLRTYLKQKQF